MTPVEGEKKNRKQKFYGTPATHWAAYNGPVRNVDSAAYKTHLTQGDFKRQKI